jgi:hypothetical protein
MLAGPPAALLLSLVPGRDFAVVKAPRSNADQDGIEFGALLIYLPFDPLPTPPSGFSALKHASRAAVPAAQTYPSSSKNK